MAQNRSQLPAAQPTVSGQDLPSQNGEARHPHDRSWIGALSAVLLVLIFLFIKFTPAGFWNKLMVIGSAVCHQDPTHSFFIAGLQMPLCARCTGMYLGALLSFLFHFLQGRNGRFPPRYVLIVLGLFFLAFAMDSLNSLAASLGKVWNIYQTTNLTRLATGMGAGIVIGAVLAPLFNQTVWANWGHESALSNGKTMVLLLAASALIVLGVYVGPSWLRYLAAILSILGVLLVLIIAYSTLAVFLLKRENQAQSWKQLCLPLLMGALATTLQIGIFHFLRFYLFPA